MLQFNHFNFNVLDLDRSLDFYRKALELEVVEEKTADDGSFKLVYLGDGETSSPTGLMSCWRATGPWAASALRTRPWAFTSSRIRTTTGLRSSRSIAEPWVRP